MEALILIVGGLAAIVLAVGRRPHLLLIADLLFVVVPNEYEVGGLFIDISDFMFAGILLSFLLGRWQIPRAWQGTGMRAWVALGLIMSAAYMAAAPNQEYMTNSVRVAYQLYRYCWKPILYFPLSIILLRPAERWRTALLVLVITGDVCSIQAVLQGYSGLRATGSFGYGSNSLAGALMVPLVFSAAGVVSAKGRRIRQFYFVSALLIGRALMFAGSRGSVAALLLAALMLAWGLKDTAMGRRRIVRFAGFAFYVGMAMVMLMPGIMQRPNVSRMFSVSEGTGAETFQWRLHERWPHFLHKVMDNPMLGVGSDADLVFGLRGNTPHNGYLSFALLYGIPGAVLALGMMAWAVWLGLRIRKRAARFSDQTVGLMIAAAMSALFVHNIVESTFTDPFIRKMMWLMTATAVILFHAVRVEARTARTESAKPPTVVAPAAWAAASRR